VFQRRGSRDMFEFFGPEGGHNPVNPSYWSEKCVASGLVGTTEFSEYKFRESILSDVDDYLDGRNEGGNKIKEFIVESIEDEIFSHLIDGDYQSAINAAREYEYDGDCIFIETDVSNYEFFTYHYLWACLAIQRGILIYNQSKHLPGCFL